MVSVHDIIQGRERFRTRPPVVVMKMGQGPPLTGEAEAADKGKGKRPVEDTTAGARAKKTRRTETEREVLPLFAIQDRSQQRGGLRDWSDDDVSEFPMLHLVYL